MKYRRKAFFLRNDINAFMSRQPDGRLVLTDNADGGWIYRPFYSWNEAFEFLNEQRWARII